MKAFASDFDGTFFFMEQTEPFKKCDIEAIKIFQSQGHSFGLCTGRPLIGTLEYLPKEIQPDFYITNSGASIYNKEKQLICEKTFSKETTDALITYGVDHGFAVDFHMNEKFYAFGKSDCFITDEIYSLYEINGRVHNITYNAGSVEKAEELVKIMSEKFKNQITAFRNTQYVDIVPFGCSKGFGIDFIRTFLKIDTFAGIGDSMNDLPMLDKVDAAFTFTDAPKKLQEKAIKLVKSLSEAVKEFLNEETM